MGLFSRKTQEEKDREEEERYWNIVGGVIGHLIGTRDLDGVIQHYAPRIVGNLNSATDWRDEFYDYTKNRLDQIETKMDKILANQEKLLQQQYMNKPANDFSRQEPPAPLHRA